MLKTRDKLERLAEIEGLDVMEMLERCICDSVAPGICTNDGCSYSTEVEPDSRGGFCEECGTQSVVSCLILAGVM